MGHLHFAPGQKMTQDSTDLDFSVGFTIMLNVEITLNGIAGRKTIFSLKRGSSTLAELFVDDDNLVVFTVGGSSLSLTREESDCVLGHARQIFASSIKIGRSLNIALVIPDFLSRKASFSTKRLQNTEELVLGGGSADFHVYHFGVSSRVLSEDEMRIARLQPRIH